MRTEMAKSKLRRRLILIVALLLMLYSAGYVVCRFNKSIVHSQAVSTANAQLMKCRPAISK